MLQTLLELSLSGGSKAACVSFRGVEFIYFENISEVDPFENHLCNSIASRNYMGRGFSFSVIFERFKASQSRIIWCWFLTFEVIGTVIEEDDTDIAAVVGIHHTCTCVDHVLHCQTRTRC